MKRDLLLYQRALFLRIKKGYSYGEIRGEIRVSKSTLSDWLNMIELTPAQKRRIRQVQIDKMFETWGPSGLGEWNRKKRQEEVQNIRSKARQEVQPLSASQFFIAGVMLYWAEGSKAGKEVRVSNADPAFIQFMMRWFREYCHIPENLFRASIHYHQGQDELKIRKYWSRLSGIPLEHFYKSFLKPPGTGHRKHVLQNGVIQIRLRKSADLLHRITAWREGLIESIISGKPSK